MPGKTPISEDKIKQIKALHKQGRTVEEITKQTGVSAGSISKYIKEPPEVTLKPAPVEPVKTEKPETPVQPAVQPVKQQPDRQTPPAQAMPYPETPEPEDWLRSFLEQYRLKEPFIRAQCARVIRRRQLPGPSDLMVDMKEGDSGQKNLLMIRDIVEDYDYAVEDYMKKRDNLIAMPMTRRHGISVDREIYPQDRFREGIPIRGQQPYYPQQGQPHDPRYERHPDYYDRQGIPIGGVPQSYYYPPPYQTLESELERLAKIQTLFQKTEEKNPLMERLEAENQVLANRLSSLEEERKRSLAEENRSLKDQIMQFAERRRVDENKIRDLEIVQSQQSLSETDVRMAEIKDKHTLEMAKLDEKGKTRDAIAGAVKTGFGQVGAAIARTVQEMGTEEKRTMHGVTDDRHTWTAECPFCATSITAPLSAKVIQCPNCGRKLRRLTEEEEQAPPLEEGGFAPSAQFTVEPPVEQYPEPPPPIKEPIIRDERPALPKEESKPEPELRKPHEEPLPPMPPVEKTSEGVKEIEGKEKTIEPDILEPETKPPQQVAETALIDKVEGLKIEGKMEGDAIRTEPAPAKPDYRCPDCGKRFGTEMQLKGHMLHHLKQKKKKKEK